MRKFKQITTSLLLAIMLTVSTPTVLPVLNTTQTVEAAVVKLSSTKASLFIGDSMTLKMIGTTKSVKWTSSNKKVATVSSKGKVTALKKGIAKITATVGSNKYTSLITVNKQELSSKDIYKKASKATVEITAKVSSTNYNIGSGFFIDNGIIVTNYHVVAGTSEIQVSTYSGSTYVVEQVLGYDEDIDVAILKVNSNNESLVRNQEGVTVGENIYVLGSPLGLTGTFTNGMVSNASRVVEGVDYIQVTAPMSPGNSGGPLLNAYGEVMGINTWQYADGQNLNFSINILEIDNVNTSNPISVSDFYQATISYTTGIASEISYNNGSYGAYLQSIMLNANNSNGVFYMDYTKSPYGYYVAIFPKLKGTK
jgi:serine protease Do